MQFRRDNQQNERIEKLIEYVKSSFFNILVGIYPVVFLYLQNIEETNFREYIVIFVVFGFVGFASYFIFKIIVKGNYKAVVLAALFTTFILNYRLMEKAILLVLHKLKYYQVLPLLLYLIILACIAINKKCSEDIMKMVSTCLFVMYCVLIVLNLVPAIPSIIKKKDIQNNKSEVYSSNINNSENDKKNFYIFLFDEYAGFEQIRNVYGYDNSELEDFLKNNHFNISYDSHNETYKTAYITSNMMNLEYVVSYPEDTELEAEEKRKNGKLFSLLRENGYEVNIIESGTFFSNEKSRVQSNTINGEGVSDLLLGNTILYPVFKKTPSDSLNVILSEYKEVMTMEKPGSPTFTLVYYIFPHQPFIVDEHGNSIGMEDMANWKDKDIYLGQYKYCTNIMMKQISHIIEVDPHSVILLCSDHGARASTDSDLIFTDDYSFARMTNNFSALYYDGEEVDISEQSLVNTLRLIMNKMFDKNYRPLEVEYYKEKTW